MLLSVNARRPRLSKFFLYENRPAHRWASLTGAIQRGARKARDDGERSERYNMRSNSKFDTGCRRDDKSGSRLAAPSEEQFVMIREAKPGQHQQGGDNRRDGEGNSRYFRGRTPGFNQNRQLSERFSKREGDRSPYKPRDDGRRDNRGEPTYPRKDAERVPRDRRSAEPFSQRKGGLGVTGSFARRNIGGLNAPDSKYPRTDAKGVGEHRRSPERFSQEGGIQWERDSFRSRNIIRGYGLDKIYPTEDADEAARDRRPAEHFSRMGGDRKTLRQSRNGKRGQGTDSRHPRSDTYDVARNRQPPERFPGRERDLSSISRKPIGRESSSRAVEGDESGARALELALDEVGEVGPGLPQSKGDRRSHTQKPTARQPPLREAEGMDTEHSEQASISARRHVTVPLSIPRSSAASEFIYGTSAVKSALQSGSRKLHKLYIYQGASGTEEREGDKQFFKLAKERGVKVKGLGGNDLRILDKMAQARPHNGYVLEASQLPNPPAEALDRVARLGEDFSFTPGYQSKEELLVNGTSRDIAGSSNRYPFVLMLDSILDPGNLGAIIRSAAFFGVNAIALIDHNLAPFSPVTLKASSGAAEYMRYLRIKKDCEFVKRSKSNGWKFFAAVAPESASASRVALDAVRLKLAESALMEGPCVLMLGGEGDGLRTRLQKAADGMVGIKGAGNLNAEYGMDSLNVSVAAALMMQTFLKGSPMPPDDEVSETETERSEDDEHLF
jgi:21S rRNA (GM2251-2'-O)-methyltransferase